MNHSPLTDRDLSNLSDRDLEQVQNAAYYERLQRMERDARVEASSAKYCGTAPVRAGAMTLGDVATVSVQASCDTATAPPPPRSFAPPRSIGWAIKQLDNGARVTRRGWNGQRQWLALQIPDGGSFMTLPYLYIRTVTGDRVPWLASQTDLLASDWQLAP